MSMSDGSRTPPTVASPTLPAPESGGPVTDVVTPRDDVPPAVPSLGRKMRTGVLWTAITRFAAQGLQFASSIALARLLLPEDFGLVALVIATTGFAGIFVELGLGAAVVQRPELDDALLTTAFWLNAVLGVVMALTITLTAPLLAVFYGAPELTYLLPTASLVFVVSLGVVQTGLLRRELDFRRLGVVSVVNTAVTALVSISAAASGIGPMALVLGTLAGTIASTVQLWVYLPWRPRGRPSRESATDLWRFSRGLLGFSTVNYWSRNADNLLVGKFLGVTALGFYGRAYNLMMMPVTQMSAVLSTVLFPALSKLQRDQKRFGQGWLVSTKASWLLGAPLGVGVAVTAPALVEVLYGERWLPMAPVLALLSASVPAQLLGSNTGPVFQALGRTGLQFKLGLVTSSLTVLAIVVALPHGIVAVAFALAVKSWVLVWVPLLPALRLAGVRLSTLGRSLAFTAMSTGLMAIAAWSPRWFMGDASPVAVLLTQVTLGALVFCGLIVIGERPYLRTLRGRR